MAVKRNEGVVAIVVAVIGALSGIASAWITATRAAEPAAKQAAEPAVKEVIAHQEGRLSTIDTRLAKLEGTTKNVSSLNERLEDLARLLNERSAIGGRPESGHDRVTIRDESGKPLRVVVGSTKANNTRWKQYVRTDGVVDPNAIYVEVDTSAARFSDTPRYFVSISGGSGLYKTTGLGGVNSANLKGFSVYLTFAGAINPKKANEYGWTVNWIAVGT